MKTFEINSRAPESPLLAKAPTSNPDDERNSNTTKRVAFVAVLILVVTIVAFANSSPWSSVNRQTKISAKSALNCAFGGHPDPQFPHFCACPNPLTRTQGTQMCVCKAGNKAVNGNCVPCAQGTYSRRWNAAECKSCPGDPGVLVTNADQTDCVCAEPNSHRGHDSCSCNTGFGRSNGANSTCAPCPKDTRSATKLFALQSGRRYFDFVCEACPAGMFKPHPTVWGNCESCRLNGSFNSATMKCDCGEGAAPTGPDGKCECQPGWFSKNPDTDTKCTRCSANYISTKPGRQYCNPCLTGTSNTAHSSCNCGPNSYFTGWTCRCNPGYTMEGNIMPFTCKACTGNTVSPGGDKCRPCDKPHETPNADHSKCTCVAPYFKHLKVASWDCRKCDGEHEVPDNSHYRCVCDEANGWFRRDGFPKCMPQKCKGYYLPYLGRLDVDDYLLSQNGHFKAILQSDGNFVLYRVGGGALWDSHSSNKGSPPYFLVLQGDKNVVLYGLHHHVLWSTGTSAPGAWIGTRLVLQDDGNLVLYTGHHVWWHSHTAGRWKLQEGVEVQEDEQEEGKDAGAL